jgi:hypothetical protein
MHRQDSGAPSSMSIDDFLLNYRHHQISIQDFMLALTNPGCVRETN